MEISSLDDVRAAIGEGGLEDALARCAPGSADADGSYAIERDWGRDRETPFTPGLLQSWVDSCLRGGEGSLGEGEVWHPLSFDGATPACEVFAESLADFTEESLEADPYEGDLYAQEVAYIASDLMGEVEGALERALGGDADVDVYDLEPQLASFVRDHTHMDWGLGALMRSRTVCVDLLLATGEEAAHDLSFASLAGCLQYDDRTFGYYLTCSRDEAVGMVRQSALGWLCRSQGQDVSCLWEWPDRDSTAFARSAYREAEESTCEGGREQVVVCATMTVASWAVLEGAVAYGLGGDALRLEAGTDATIGLFDRMGGGGSVLMMELDRDVSIPLSLVNDAAVDPQSGGKLVGRVWGHTAHDTFGAFDCMWGSLGVSCPEHTEPIGRSHLWPNDVPLDRSSSRHL